MPKFSARWVVSVVLGIVCPAALGAGVATNGPAAEPFDYAQPARMTGTVFETGSDHKKVLFNFERTATRHGDTVRVERKFTLPNGTTAATEDIVYESGPPVSLEMKEFQAGLWGEMQIKTDAKNPAHQKIIITHGKMGEVKKAGTTDDLQPDTLVDDTLYPFIVAHWDELMRGGPVKFRLVSLEWEKTYGFKLTKTGEAVVDGKPVVVIQMVPTNMLVAEFMDPITFSLEKDGAQHRMVEYLGRTTPRIKSGKAWKYLDADTVFDWK
jgi:hypothetical protein